MSQNITNPNSLSSTDVGQGDRNRENVRSPRSASFGGVERIRSSSFDGFHSKHFVDASYEYPKWNVSSFMQYFLAIQKNLEM